MCFFMIDSISSLPEGPIGDKTCSMSDTDIIPLSIPLFIPLFIPLNLNPSTILLEPNVHHTLGTTIALYWRGETIEKDCEVVRHLGDRRECPKLASSASIRQYPR